MTVRYAINVPNFGEFADPQVLLEFAREAETAGWDGLFMWDHIKLFREWNLPVVDPWVALAAVASVTERLTLGPMVTPLPRRRPTKLARETVTLDHLSEGRLVLGVGIGAPADVDFADFGDVEDARLRGEMLDEGLSVLTGLWSGEPFTHEGKHYLVRGTTFLPKPVQQPRIPVWVAGFWPNKRPFRRAAAWDGVFPIMVDQDGDFLDITGTDLQEMLAYVQEHRTSNGPFEVALAGVSEDVGAARLAEYAEIGMTWWTEALGHPRHPFEYYRDRVKAGPPRIAP